MGERREHPLPWRWESPPADKDLVILVDSTGRVLVSGVGGEPGWARVASPYVRAVTERAGAMEVLLKRALAGIHATASERSIALDVMETADDIEDLLAEIDAAKAGG